MEAYINGISYYLPEKVLTNAALSDMYPDWPIDKISKRIGVESRHIAASDEYSSDLAIAALNKLIDEFSINKEAIDYLILCTQTPNYSLPATACIVQDKTGLPKSCGAIDISLGCSGYVYGLGFAKGLILSGQAKNVVFITAETLTKTLHPDDKGNRALFGDGATATLITSQPDTSRFCGLIKNFKYGTDGSGYDKLIIKNSSTHSNKQLHDTIFDEEGNFISNDDFLYMNGNEIFNFTAFEIPKLVEQTLKENTLEIQDIAMTVFHQANTYMLDFIRKRCKIAEDKMYIDMKDVGNTISSTIPIGLRRLLDENKIAKKDNLLLSGFGVGLSMAGVIIETEYI
ncbi:MAG: ketoacyl-ACP synthase III [Flavobacterium sp. JAD_PAG50586_2]|nr:MAG: ketoacyl-ACP synthase III [Flavobacterium sp. JAD_PAG50586_2]